MFRLPSLGRRANTPTLFVCQVWCGTGTTGGPVGGAFSPGDADGIADLPGYLQDIVRATSDGKRSGPKDGNKEDV